jgi:hypothetical protein
MPAIDVTADRYLRSLNEAVAADSMAALAARDDIVRLAERQGVTVVVAAQAVLEATGTWTAARRFRLLNYLKAGLVDVAVAARCGWTVDPVPPGDQDLHVIALQAGTGRLLASATLRRPQASAGACLADRNRPLLQVEETFGIGVYDCMPAVAALGLDQVAEVKRLVRDQDLRGMAGLRVALETVMALLVAPCYAWDHSTQAWLGTIESGVVGRLLSFLHTRVHSVNAQPSPSLAPSQGGTNTHYLSRHFAEGQARPFVLWTTELGSTARRCSQVRAALALPDQAAAKELAALREPTATQREPQP